MPKTSHELSIEFAVEITELCSKIKDRPERTKQLICSASSIGADIAQAKYAESNADFVHKLEILQKEANEAETWLSVALLTSSHLNLYATNAENKENADYINYHG